VICLFILIFKDERSEQYTGDGSVDFRGKPAIKHNTGNWRACPFILGMLLSH
jgi:peptide/histidine transporter 3/4